MLDTNILISILIFDSYKLKNMIADICLNHKLILSSYILEELKRVVERKFPNKKEKIYKVLYKIPFELIIIDSKIYEIENYYIRDSKDFPILCSAIMSNVDILITGDKDFKNINIEGLIILTPSEYMDKYYYGYC